MHFTGVFSSFSRKTTILIVDDEPDLLESWATLLELEGYSVMIAHDATQGLQAATEYVPAVVITDYRMPGPDGLDLCRQLKSEARTKKIPIIMWTGTPMRRHKDLFERIAVKPAALGTMLALIQDVLH